MIQIVILLYLLIFGSGFWLSRRGKPFNVVLLTVHKLVSLAAVVLLAFVVYRVSWEATLRATDWIAVAVTGLFFLGTIATGGLLSADRPKSARARVAVLWAHRITPFLTVLSTAATLYLLLSPKV
jgi:hypothetical protein